MNRILSTLFFIIFIFACTPQKEELTFEDVENEKKAIVQVMKDYNTASEEENFIS